MKVLSALLIAAAAPSAAAALFLAAPAPLEARQTLPVEVGVFHLSGMSDLSELEHPKGMALGLRIRARPWLAFRAGVFSKGDDSTRNGRVCITFEPPSNCRDEVIQHTTTLVGAEVAAHLVRRLHPTLEFDVGAGVSMSRIAAEETTESGRRSNLLGQNSGQPGLTVSATGRFRPLGRVPFVVEAGFAQHLIRMNACSENPGLYIPFCGFSNLGELRIGLAFAPAW